MKSLLTIYFLFLCAVGHSQYKISIIEVYGNRTIPDSIIRRQLPYKAGDTISPNTFNKDLVTQKLKSISGVLDVDVSMICCDNKTSGVILFAGISEIATKSFIYHAVPDGNERLPAEVMQTVQKLEKARFNATTQGNSAEDTGTTYSLLLDTATRKWQLKYLDYAKQYKALINTVLYHSNDAEHRALAAEIIAYDPDKKYVIRHLLHAVYDPNEGVRNNATRALGILQNYLVRHPDKSLVIPSAPFIQMLNSVVWTDRNKGSLILNALTQQDHPSLLATLRKECLPALIEMARWKSDGHAFQAYFLLGRIAGYTDEQTYKGFTTSDRNVFLEEVINKIK